MSQEEAAKSPQSPSEDETEQSTSSVEETSEPLDDSQLDAIAGGDGNPDDPPQQEITIFRSPV